jgi:Na+/melibiose symporter-like transporter
MAAKSDWLSTRMANNKYWFARRFPVGHPRRAMSPVSQEGWRVVGAFAVALVAGILMLMFLATNGQVFWGVTISVVIIGAMSIAFVVLANVRGDHERTVEDYRNGNGRNAPPSASRTSTTQAP